MQIVNVYIMQYCSYLLQQKTIVVANDARRTVEHFCRWATVQAYNNQYYGGGHKFDVAVYLTRTGLGPAGKILALPFF